MKLEENGWFKDLISKLKMKGSQIHSISFFKNMKSKPITKDQLTSTYIHLKNGFILHKWTIFKSVSALGFLAVAVWSGNQYVQANVVDVYHVYVEGEELGTVSSQSIVEQFKEQKKQEVSKDTNGPRMIVSIPGLEFKPDKAFKGNTEDQHVLERLNSYVTAYPIGVQLVVDGKPIGIVKDTETATKILEQIKSDVIASIQKKKNPGKVGVLSASSEASTPAETEIQKAEFVQNVELKEVQIDPQELMTPETVHQKLETGDIKPTKYTVEKGDCVSCIAKKLNISKQVIYQNNPSIADDMIKVGQQIDVTVLQPVLAVRTVEKVVENQDIQYETEYMQDDSLRVGTTQTVSPGKNGQKKITIELTKVNGLMEEEKVLNEEIVQLPVKAVVKKGTKVIKGEGTGKFAWPVLSATITSTFGTRWGAFHKGVDLTGNRNIMASDNGRVAFAGVKDGYGNCIIIDHLNGYKTLYGHLSQINTNVGKIVEKGEKIGYMGSTGDSTGVHLHFEVQRDDVPDNPLKYLNR